MKKTLAALAVLGAFAGTATAADITLYGVVDTGLVYAHKKAEHNVDIDLPDGQSLLYINSKKSDTLQMESGINAGSRFGLKGIEDIGNGIKVGFKLENGFNSDDGTMKFDDRLFGREAAVTVYSPAGELAFGRMGGVGSAAGTYDTVYAIGDSFDGGDLYAFGLQASSRYDNMLTYRSPKLAGVQATMQYSFKTNNKVEDDKIESNVDEEINGTVRGSDQIEGRSTAERYFSVALTGEWGPAQVVAAYELQKYSTLYRDEDLQPKDGQTISLGGNVDLGAVRLFAMGQYFRGQRNFAGMNVSPLGKVIYEKGDSTNGLLVGLGSEKGWQGYGLHLGAIVPVAAGDLTVGAYYANAKLKETGVLVEETGYEEEYGDGDLKGEYFAFATRYAYPLSTRTTVYAGASYADSKFDEGTYKDKIGAAYLGLTHTF